jgi:hypothetical protein
MGDAKLGVLEVMEKCVERFAGKAIAQKVMEGSEQITKKTDKKKVAEWIKGAMKKLDALVDEGTRVQIMQNCGYNCAEVNRKTIERAKARRKKYKSLDEFLKAEQQKPMKGTRLVREGSVLHQFYTPQTFTRPMRCYCSLLRGLPPEEKISITYCSCSKGFVEKFWESVLEKPVKVDLIHSAVSGTKECKFTIHM